MAKEFWEKQAKQYLKAELKRRDVSYEKLAEMLTEKGIPETEGSISMKISRGTYPAWFLFAVMSAIGVSVLRLGDE